MPNRGTSDLPASPTTDVVVSTGTADDEVGLVRRVAAGELHAFEQLYRLYHPRLTRFLERMMRRPGPVGEVLDDTLLVVWHGAARYDGSCKVSTWIFAIAYRKALKALHRLDEPVEDDAAAADRRADDGPGPDQQLGHRQLRAALLRALGGLSAEQRAAVDLTYFHGMGCHEIAQIAGCPVNTVKTRMFHARRRLRTLLGGALEDWL